VTAAPERKRVDWTDRCGFDGDSPPNPRTIPREVSIQPGGIIAGRKGGSSNASSSVSTADNTEKKEIVEAVIPPGVRVVPEGVVRRGGRGSRTLYVAPSFDSTFPSMSRAPMLMVRPSHTDLSIVVGAPRAPRANRTRSRPSSLAERHMPPLTGRCPWPRATGGGLCLPVKGLSEKIGKEGKESGPRFPSQNESR